MSGSAQLEDGSHSTIGQAHVRLSAARPVRVHRLDVDRPVGPHDHDFTELCLVLEGEGRHLRAGGVDHLQSGTVVVIPPGPVHAFEDLHGLRVVNVYFLPEWFLWDIAALRQHEGLVPLFFGAHLFPRQHPRISVFSLLPEELAACDRELLDLEAESQQPAPSPLFIRGAFAKLLVLLSRAAGRSSGFLNDFDFRPEIWRALEQMDAALKEGATLNVAALARDCGFSADGFCRLFKSSTGLTPTDYFSWRRAQHAGNLLLRTDLAVGTIAAQLGFADTAHLTRQFSRWQNCSPREFRRKFGHTITHFSA